MRIALVHSFYSSGTPSGENVVVELQANALRRAGYTVDIVGIWTDVERGRVAFELRTAARIVSGRGRNPLAILRELDPDLIHIHNLFPNYSTNWLKKWTKPVVATMHNYRAFCAEGLLTRNGSQCTDCMGKAIAWPALRYRCYRSSLMATVPMFVRTSGGVARDSVIQRADHLVMLSERSKEIYEDAGLSPKASYSVIPNFALPNVISSPPSRPWIFAGRLAKSKGIVSLIENWPQSVKLDIFGDGPLRNFVQEECHGGISYHGAVDHQTLLKELPGRVGLVFPSIGAEGMPTIYLEALAAGLPTLATSENSVGKDVGIFGTGLLIQDFRDLPALTAKVSESWQLYHSRAIDRFHNGYSEAAWTKQMMKVYMSVLNGVSGC